MTGHFNVPDYTKCLFSTWWPWEYLVVVTGNVQIRDGIALSYLYFTVVPPQVDVVRRLSKNHAHTMVSNIYWVVRLLLHVLPPTLLLVLIVLKGYLLSHTLTKGSTKLLIEICKLVTIILTLETLKKFWTLSHEILERILLLIVLLVLRWLSTSPIRVAGVLLICKVHFYFEDLSLR